MNPWQAEPEVPAATWHAEARLHGTRIALGLATALATYALFPASPAVDSPVLEVGSVASLNVIAPFAFKVPKSPSELAT